MLPQVCALLSPSRRVQIDHKLDSPGVCRDSLLPVPPSVNSCFMFDYKFINSFMGL
jgi:hypothetical protein